MTNGRPGEARGGDAPSDEAELARLEALADRSRCQLVDAIETLADGFVLYDEEDRLVLCNDRYRELYALSAPALVSGARFEDVLRYGLERGQYADAVGREEAWLAERLRAHRQPSSTIVQRLSSGRCLRIVERTTPDGGRVGLRIDITAEKAAQARLEASNRRLDQLLESSPAMIYAADVQTWQPTYVSGNCVDLLGYTADDILAAGTWWQDHLHPDDRQQVMDRAAAWFAGGAPEALRHSYRLRRADGRYLWVEDQLRVLRDEAGEMTEMVGSSVDITERKRLEQRLEAEHAFLDRIMATSLSAIVVLDEAGAILFANTEAERVLGGSAQPVGGRRYDDPARRITGVDGGPLSAAALPVARVMASGRAVDDMRHEIEWPDGSRRILSVNAAPLPASPDSTARVVCSVTDITDRIAAEKTLHRQEALLRGLFELCPVGIALNDYATGKFLDVNAALLAPTGYTKEEFLQLDYFDVTPEEYHQLEVPERESLARHGRYGPFEKAYRRKDGSRYPVLLNGIMVEDQDGTPLIWSIIEDISERKANEARMLLDAHHDHLTGLANRRLFDDRLASATERTRRSHNAGAVLMLDLDHFKPVNDSLGHAAGDAILIETARRLVACTRKTDTVARFGGDEFVVLLDDISAAADVEAIAHKMRRALEKPFLVEGERVRLGLTIGICRFPDDSDDPEEIVHFADTAMYAAKHSGRNAIRFHAPERHDPPPATRRRPPATREAVATDAGRSS